MTNNKHNVAHDWSDITYDQKLMPSQPFFSELFQDTDVTFEQAMMQAALKTGGDKIPAEKYDLEFSPDMPVQLMGSNPTALSFLQSLVLLHKPQTILEIGTFIGLSAIYMASALPEGGKLTSLEKYDSFAEIARGNIARNGLGGRVEVIAGDASKTLPELQDRRFDMAFVDGHKEAYADYLDLIDPLVPVGGLIITDDIFFHGDALNSPPRTEKGAGVKRFMDKVAGMGNYHRCVMPMSNGILLMIKRS